MRATVVDSVCPLNDREVVDRIIEFSEHINQRTLYAYQVLFSRRIVETVLKQDGQTVTGLFSRQSGKCFAKGTPIMMADGLLKSVEDVVVGDRVMGDDGTPRNVLNLSRGRSLMYRVSAKTNYHDSYVCNAQHLVTVYNERTGAVEDVQAKKLYLSSEHSTHPDGDSVVRHLKGMQGSVQFKAQPVPIDPYWLGLWIGDGTSRSTAITNIDQEVIDYIYEYAEELGMQVAVYPHAVSNASSYAINRGNAKAGQFGQQANELHQSLQSLNLICNKHIPSIYRFNDEETRRLLLAGLIDSDGSKSNKNSSNTTSACEITFKQKVLAEHTQWLMRSLRLRASLSEKVVNGVSYWRVVGFGDFREIPTRVPRKQWRDDEVPMRDHMRFGMRIKSLGVDNFYGFETDGNHRFLLGDFTVTHNSETLACISLALVLILPALAQEFPDDKRFKSFVHGVAIGVFAPSKHHSGIIYSRMRSRVESSFFDELLADPTIDTKIAHSRGDSFAFENGSRVEAHTASENVLNEGGTFHLVLVDESQKLSTQKIDKELRPMLASTNGSMVMIGTAFMGGGAFYKQINTNLGGERATGIKNHFQFPYDVVIKHRRALFNKDQNPAHLNYEKWVAAELARLGGNIENSSFKMNFRLLWGSSSSFAVPMVLFKSLGRVDLEANRPWFGQGRVVAGIDFAKSNDHTWITVGYVDTVAPIIQNAKFGREQSMTTYSNRTILGWKMLQGLFEGEGGQYAQIISFLSYWPQLQCVVADGTGMGDPICERLQSLLPGITVIPYVFTTPSKHFMYTTYLQEVEARRISYPAGPATVQTPEYQAFISQHEGLAKTHVGQYIKCEAASEDEHEDACDSACLFVIAGETVTVPDVNPSARRGSSNTVPMVDLGSNRPLIIGGNSNGRYSTRW